MSFNSRSFEKVAYSEIQASMQPGDVIAFSGGTLVSRVIMAVTQSNVSHVGMIVPSAFLKGAEEPVIGEVNQNGVIFSRVSTVIARNSTPLWWLPLTQRPDAESLWNAVATHKETSYDYQQAFMLVFELLEPAFADAGQQVETDIYRLLSDTLVPSLRDNILERVPSFVRSSVAGILSESLLRSIVLEVLEAHLDIPGLVDPLVVRLQNQDDPKQLFCSEFVANVLRDSHVIQDIEPSQTTPIELCTHSGIYDANGYVQFHGNAEERIQHSVSIPI